MSRDRFDAEAGEDLIVVDDDLQRCSLKHAQEARRSYCGVVRSPLHPDELGAVSVVELQFGGGRIAFFRISDSTVCEVRRLGEVTAVAPEPPRSRPAPAASRRRAISRQDAGPLFGVHK